MPENTMENLPLIQGNLSRGIVKISHCHLSSNLFQGQITQKHIDQMSSPENKKCSPWKVFGINHPQTPRLLSRRGPRSFFLFSGELIWSICF